MTRKIILALATILPVHLQLHARNKLTLRRSAPVAELIPAKLAVQALPPVYGKTTPVSCPVRLVQYWNGTACVSSTTTGQCPSGQSWYTPPAGGAGYCQSSTTYSSDPATACAQGGGTWNTSTNYCQMSSTNMTGQCPSGQYWYTPSSGGAGYCMSTSNTNCASGQYWNGSACVSSSSTTTTPTPSSTCSSGQYWDGASCVTSPTPTPTSTPTPTPEPTPTPPPPDPATMCAQGGGTWTGSTCQMAKSISDQKDYLSYFQKDSSSLVAQVLRAFADLFR